LETAGAGKRVELHSGTAQLHADGKDIAQVEYDVVDARGVRVPDFTDEMTFELSGPAQILGLGNGDVTNCEPVKGPNHRAYEGRGLATVQASTAPGQITLRVSSPGIEPATMTLVSQ
jgi:beta-galactosidase